MRISDWSSDVCSSDLNANAESLVAQSFRDSLSTTEEMLTPPASPAALDRTIEDADNAIADARRQLGEHDFWPLRDAAEAMAQEAGRSEEHTSELQSLMRISYAVFCLKKKNKRNRYLYI